MKLHSLFFLFGLCFELGETFFLLEAKAIYFCVKVCPLYCSKREKRDAGPPYWDDEYEDNTYISFHPSLDHDRSYVYEPPHYHRHQPRFYHCDKTTTSTSSTTTTTKKPETSGICEFCNKKCGTPLPL